MVHRGVALSIPLTQDTLAQPPFRREPEFREGRGRLGLSRFRPLCCCVVLLKWLRKGPQRGSRLDRTWLIGLVGLTPRFSVYTISRIISIAILHASV